MFAFLITKSDSPTYGISNTAQSSGSINS